MYNTVNSRLCEIMDQYKIIDEFIAITYFVSDNQVITNFIIDNKSNDIFEKINTHYLHGKTLNDGYVIGGEFIY